MGRRSNAQLCIDLKKERGSLYSKRSNITKKLQNKKLQGDARKKLDKEWETTTKKLDSLKEKLFRCGKKYSAFKKQRTKLRRHQRYLLAKVRKGGMPKKDLNRTYMEMRRTAQAINQVENAMLLPVGKLKTGVTGFVAIEGGVFKTDEVLWALASMFSKWADSGEFEVLVLDDELIDLADNPIVAKIKVDLAIQEAMAWQHINPSPHFFAMGDVPNGYLEIKVMNYEKNMYDNESF